MENDVIRRLIYSGILAALGALASIAAARGADIVYRRLFDEEPPE